MHPGPHGLFAVAELAGDASDRAVRGPELVTELADEADGLFLLGGRVAPQRWAPWLLLLWHGSIFLSKMWSLQGIQGGSRSEPAAHWSSRHSTRPPCQTGSTGSARRCSKPAS